MAYTDSYIYKLRQKVGKELILTTTVVVIPVRQDGKIKLVNAPHMGGWTPVGGHCEPGDSFASAALHELKEEAGITAGADDLELFATISGAGRIFHYADGDTQPFTLAFFLRNWQDEGDNTDKEEISGMKWVDLNEAIKMPANESVKLIFTAYQKFLATGKVQMIEQATDVRADYTRV